jgi:hypothetical protein
MPPLITGFSGLIRLSSSEQLGKMPDMFPTLPTSVLLNKPKSSKRAGQENNFGRTLATKSTTP